MDVMANSLVYWTQDLFFANLLSPGGRIFAMTSAGDHIVWPAYGAVSAAKCALESYVRQLAVELAPEGHRGQRPARRRHGHAGPAQDPRQRGHDRAHPRAPSGRPPHDAGRRRAGARGALRRGRRLDLRQRHRRRRRRRHRGRKVERRLSSSGAPSSSFREKAGFREFRLKSNGLSVLLLAEPRRAGRDLRGRLPRRQPQRGRRPHGRHAPARAPHVQGNAGVRPRARAPRSPRCSRRSARGSTRRPGSTGRTTTRRSPPTSSRSRCAIEASRMRQALLRDEDRVPEMTVVRNEFERGENSPFQVLYKHTFATAFREHPYHHPTIGWRSDIEEVSTERLREFYDTFYHPNNATAMVIGDFDEAEALALLARAFGPIPSSPPADPEGLHGRAAAGRGAALHRAARRPDRVVRPLLEDRRGAACRHARPRRARQHPRRRHHRAPPPGARREEPRALRDRRAVAAARSGALLGVRSRAAGRRAVGGRVGDPAGDRRGSRPTASPRPSATRPARRSRRR